MPRSALTPKTFKSLNYILDNRVVFPTNLKKITTIYNSYGGKENSISRDFVIKHYPTIQHFNPQTECKRVKYQKTSSFAKIVIELDDGTQTAIKVQNTDNEQTLAERIKQTALSLTETQYEPEVAIFIKDFANRVNESKSLVQQQ